MPRLRSPLLALAVPVLVVACSGGGGALDGTVPPAGEADSTGGADAGAGTVAATVGSSGSTASPTDAGGATDAASSASACPYTGTPFPTSSFASCGDDAVCAPTALVPAASQADFATCATGRCVPTKVLAAYGNYLPATCASLENAEGRCLNVVLPSVASQKDELPQATCDADERCVPCFDPLDGTATGACTTVSCDAPKQPATTFPTCCTLGGAPQGRCVPASVVGSAAGELDGYGCSQPGDLCAPAEALNPSFVPQACTADDSPIGFITGSYTGVCVSLCTAWDLAEGLGVGQGNCDDLHFCAPCTDPLTGDATGVPGCPNP